jgi:small subunit ribosomal protein S8
MSFVDPIADMLVRMRNAMAVGRDVVDVPHSKIKGEIARILKREGYLADYVTEGGGKKVLRIYIRYTAAHEPVIHALRRVSKSGLRKYVSADKLPRVLDGLGTAILSTPKGILTEKEAREARVGGEVLCTVW